MKKIKWNRIFIAIIFIISSFIIFNDIYKLLIKPFTTKILTSFTPFGLLTFILFIIINTNCYNKLKGWWNN